jgi:hypothetical protein
MYKGTLPPVSNRATWSESIECFDDEDNTPIDISQATEIIVQVSDCGCVKLKASLTEGTVTFGATGVFSFTFSKAQMGALCAKTYDFDCLVTMAGETEQPIAAQLPVIEGHVR